MVLPHENVFSILQPNLNWVQAEQENIVSELDTLAWQNRRNHVEYERVSLILEEEKRQARNPMVVFKRIVERFPPMFLGINLVVELNQPQVQR